MAYRIGIDAGSKTIKLVVLDDNGDLVHHIYWRHRSNIRKTLLAMLNEFSTRWGGVEGHVAITGSAGISLAKMLGVPFVQEVIATTEAVRRVYPRADAIIELGGEDAKVVYLSETIEQRMNATCAGGTGGFIDTIAFMLGVRTAEMNQLARRAEHVYPIASRCAVFAQTDVRPLLNAGARKEDIAASVFEAVVRQTIGGLACGRPIKGTVVFLGGPLAYLPDLAQRFRAALGLNKETGIRPENAHLFTAIGAAMAAQRADCGEAAGDERPSNLMSLARLSELVSAMEYSDDTLVTLPPLFADEAERRAFDSRHAEETVLRGSLFASHGPLYLGFDAGSTTVKYALVNEAGELVSSAYQPAGGDVLETACTMLSDLYSLLPEDGSSYISQAVAIGYGDALLRAALRFDADVVETSAHLRAARAFRPDVSFVLDIGGQDMKALWVRDGRVEDAVLNEACSSGCGSFVEGTAHAMRLGPTRFSNEALAARAPLDLGTKCTVFMTSRVRHAQKAGVAQADIAAGIAYSVVKNALYRVIGHDKSAKMGNVVVVQGGAFKSDAVLRAFEKVAGVDALRPDIAHLMGAYGAALIARDRAHEMRISSGQDTLVVSSIVNEDDLDSLDPVYTSMRCDGCANACVLNVVRFDEDRLFASGNKCSKGPQLARAKISADTGAFAEQAERKTSSGSAAKRKRARSAEGVAGTGATARAPQTHKVVVAAPKHARSWRKDEPTPNALDRELNELEHFGNYAGRKRLARILIGIESVLNGPELLPFWHAFLSYLGFTLVEPPSLPSVGVYRYGQALPDGACVPVELAHKRVEALAQAGVDAIFAPRYRKGLRCQTSEAYLSALCDAVASEQGRLQVLAPFFHSVRPENVPRDMRDFRALAEALASLAGQDAPTDAELLDALRVAYKEQIEFEKKVVHSTVYAEKWALGTPGRAAVAVVSRPCHMGRELLHDFDKELATRELAPMTALGLEHIVRKHVLGKAADKFDPSDSGMPAIQLLYAGGAWMPTGRTEQIIELALLQEDVGVIVLDDTRCEHAAETQRVMQAMSAGESERVRFARLRDLARGNSVPAMLDELAAHLARRKENMLSKRASAKNRTAEASRRNTNRCAVAYLPATVVPEAAAKAKPFNAFKVEQELLQRFAGLRQGGARANVRVGIVTALNGYELLPFWHTLFSELGLGIVVADEAGVSAARTKSAESVPSESVCEPAKLAHAQAYALMQLGANAVFMPSYERGGRCAVLHGYAAVLQDNVPFLADGSLAFASPQLKAVQPAFMEGADKQALLESLGGLPTQSPVGQAEFESAFACACAAQERFEASLQRKAQAALEALERSSGSRGIVLAGHAYHVDQLLSHGIDELLVELGFDVFSAIGLGERAGKPGHVVAGCNAAFQAWEPAGRLLRLAQQACDNPKLDFVALQSFNCCYDSAVLDDVRDMVTQAGHVFTALKVDEIVDTAHIRIRLRTMAEAITASQSASLPDDGRGTVQSAGSPENGQGGLQPACERHLLANGISGADLETARADVPADICFTASALAAHTISVMLMHPDTEMLHVPRVCQSCLVDTLPCLLGRAGVRVPEIIWHDEWPEATQATAGEAVGALACVPASASETSAVRVGIVGNPLLCFDPFMNENLTALLCELDVEPVLPDPALLFVDDVRYLTQLDAFARDGVDAVLYLQSFGCLKGHVQARGALRQLVARYPDMPITVLDYDPESSALNRENRIRLAISALRE